MKNNNMKSKVNDIDKVLKALPKECWYKQYDEPTVWKYFEQNPGNNKEDVVTEKVRLLNTHYKTHAYPNAEVAKKICTIKTLDKLIASGDPEAVDLIVEAIQPVTGNKQYSFATKYCAMHTPQAFPIYDRYVAMYFKELYKKGELAPEYDEHQYGGMEAFDDNVLRNPAEYIKMYNRFMQAHDIADKYKYRDIDLYIWSKEIKKAKGY